MYYKMKFLSIWQFYKYSHVREKHRKIPTIFDFFFPLRVLKRET